MSLTARETSLYDEVWDLPAYAEHAPGTLYLPILAEHVPAGSRVLDAGTGSGKGAVALADAGYEVLTCDLTNAGLTEAAQSLPFVKACLWKSLLGQGLPRVDAVYCTDVLEHLPTQFTMLAVRHMLDVARLGLCISVSTVPDAFGAWVGTQLHQTVQPFVWWRDALSEVGVVRDARDLVGNAVFWVTPR